MYKDFKHACQVSEPKPGELWTWSGAGGVRIVNLLTQEPPPHQGGRPGKARVEYVNHCLKALRKTIEAEKFTSVAMPKLATGVGGLGWKDVQPLIGKHLGDVNIPIVVYTTYRPGVQADEKLKGRMNLAGLGKGPLRCSGREYRWRTLILKI